MKKVVSIYLAFFCLFAYGQEGSLDLVVKSVRDVCQAPAEKSKYWSITGDIEGKGDVRVKLLGVLGGQGSLSFSKEEWDGVQNVLKEHQASDNKNYRECVKTITPLFLGKAFLTSTESEKSMSTLEAIEFLEKASKHRYSLDIGQVQALESLSKNGKPLTGIPLNEVNFSKGDYKNIQVANAQLMLSNFEGSNLDGSNFVESKLEFSNLSSVSAKNSTLIDVDFDFANMRNVDFSGSFIKDSSINAVKGQDSNYRNAKFENVLFTGSDLEGANFEGAEFKNVSFVISNIYGANFNNAKFENVEATLARLDVKKQFTKSQLENICYQGGTQNYVRVYYKTDNWEGGFKWDTLVEGVLNYKSNNDEYKKWFATCETGSFYHLDEIKSHIPYATDKRNKYKDIACEMFEHLYYCS